ncbi:MAG: bifunctional diguanylate cyclase/phosphodiesterase [Lysobacter sp.]
MNRAALGAEDWRALLLDAVTADEVIAAVERIAQSLPSVRQARLLWELGGAEHRLDDPGPDNPGQQAFADAALADGTPRTSADGRLMAIPLPASTAVLLLETGSGGAGAALADELAAPLKVADRQLRHRNRLAELEREVLRLEHSEQVQRALFAISGLAGSDRDMTEVLRGIHGIVGTLMYADNFFIVLRDPTHDTIRMLYFVDVQDPAPFDELPRDDIRHSATWYVLRDGKALRGDRERLSTQVDGPLRLFGSDSPAWLGVPMQREGTTHGAIVVQNYQHGTGFSETDQALLTFVASHILTALERKRSTESLEHNVKLRTQELAQANCDLQLEVAERQRAERLQTALFQIAQLATEDIGEEAFYARIHGVVGQLLNADNFFIALLSDDRAWLDFPYYVDPHREERPMHRPLARGLSEYVLRHQRPLLASLAQMLELERLGEVEHRRHQGPPSEYWLGVPLAGGDGVIGLLAVQSYDPAIGYGPADQELLGFVASQIANSLHRRRSAQFRQQAYAQLEERVAERTRELRRQIHEREQIQQQLQHEVMHDALTGLPNRGQLHARIESVLAQLPDDPARRCALLYLDVDRFKVINDNLGHLAGDEFLREIGRRLQACVRKPDLVARLSGDEFAILLEDVLLENVPPGGDPGCTTPTAVAQRVLELVTEPMQIAGRVLEPSASIGIAVGDARYCRADELVRDADTALYRAKALGRRRWQLFDASLQASAIDVLAIEAELREAIQHDRLEPYLQPIVRLDNGEVVGHEALLRWNHPQRGVLGPADFLQVAEDSGLIEAIDWRMFKRSLTQAAARADGSYLTINVAPRHLRREDFDRRLLELLARTGLPPSRLVIEVTEGSLLDDPERVRAVLGRLQAHGVGIALDDFGTGYSSLSYLHTFPLRMIKIDRTFLAALGKQSNCAAVVSAVIALARALDMEVVAEGIETPEQHRILMGLGCEFGQGYLFGRPVPVGRDGATATNQPVPTAIPDSL